MSFDLTRRTMIAGTLAATATAAIASKEHVMSNTEQYWPGGARLAVSLSLMFEAGGQPISGAGGVIPDPIEKGLPDLPTNAFFQYGIYEGIPRVLDLMDKHQIKLSSFMIGQAVEKAPDLAREIVRRGHEAAAHGRTWENSYTMDAATERRFISDGMASIEKATRAVGRDHAGVAPPSALADLFDCDGDAGVDLVGIEARRQRRVREVDGLGLLPDKQDTCHGKSPSEVSFWTQTAAHAAAAASAKSRYERGA